MWSRLLLHLVDRTCVWETIRACLLTGVAAFVAAFPAVAREPSLKQEHAQDTPSTLDTIPEAQQLSKEGDRLVKDGREPEAARSYLAAHEKYQHMLLHYFEQAFRSSLGGTPADEDALTRTSAEVSGLRNVNLSKLWLVLDPDDRAFEQELEEDRAGLLRRFEEFHRPSSAGPLDQFLRRLYPDDASGDRQMETMRQGTLPASKRWARLGIDLPQTSPSEAGKNSP